MLIQRVKLGLDLDETPETDAKDHRWQASPQARFERLLRETQVPIGLLSNGTHLRLVYAPRGETSGHLTFPVQAMTEVAGRPIFAALHMLLSAERLFTLPDKQRLPPSWPRAASTRTSSRPSWPSRCWPPSTSCSAASRRPTTSGTANCSATCSKDDPNQVYAGLLRVLMRLVFILYAEDRSLLSNDEVYQKYYSVTGLFERLRADAGRYPDTMDQRLRRLGPAPDAVPPDLRRRPARRHRSCCPARAICSTRTAIRSSKAGRRARQREPGERTEPPRVSDGVVFRVLQNLLILDGERLSYRTLDVEQIGSVYETMMGFNLEVAQGRSIAIKPTKPHGAPTTINLEELLAAKPADRAKWLKEKTDQAVTGQAAAALKDAQDARGRRRGPGEEDRPRGHAEHRSARGDGPAADRRAPAVGLALHAALAHRADRPHDAPADPRAPRPEPHARADSRPEGLRPGDGLRRVPGRGLPAAWRRCWSRPGTPTTACRRIPPDEDEILHARRIVAQRCLYGVDKNPMAVDLAKLSLWLATLAKDHPFTFLDHALRCGDSLVGL